MTVSDALAHLCLEDYPDDQAIRARYREYAAILHPDRHRNKAAAGLLMRKCNEAREVLLGSPQYSRRRSTSQHKSSEATSATGQIGEVFIDAVESYATAFARGNRRVIVFSAGVVIAGTLALLLVE